MQVDLIRYLTGAGSVRCVPWAMRSSRFIVFRGAEVEVFRRQERKVGSSAAPETAVASDVPAGEARQARAQLPQPRRGAAALRGTRLRQR